MSSDNGSHTTGNGAVEFYWRPGCGFCTALARKLMRAGLTFKEINIWDEPGAADRVRSATGGNETVPMIVIAGTAMVNPGAEEVLAAAREHAPHALEQQPRRRGWLPWR